MSECTAGSASASSPTTSSTSVAPWKSWRLPKFADHITFSAPPGHPGRSLRSRDQRITMPQTSILRRKVASDSGERVIDVAPYNPFAVDPGKNAIGQRVIGLLCPDLPRKRTHGLYAFVRTNFFGKKELTTCEYDALLCWNSHQQIPGYLPRELIPNIR